MLSKTLKISRLLLLIVVGFTFAFGVLAVLTPGTVIANEYVHFTGQQLSDFSEIQPKVHSYLLFEIKEAGMFLLTLTFFAAVAGIGMNWPAGDMSAVLPAIVTTAIIYAALGLSGKVILKSSLSKPEHTSGGKV